MIMSAERKQYFLELCRVEQESIKFGIEALRKAKAVLTTYAPKVVNKKLYNALNEGYDYHPWNYGIKCGYHQPDKLDLSIHSNITGSIPQKNYQLAVYPEYYRTIRLEFEISDDKRFTAEDAVKAVDAKIESLYQALDNYKVSIKTIDEIDKQYEEAKKAYNAFVDTATDVQRAFLQIRKIY